MSREGDCCWPSMTRRPSGTGPRSRGPGSTTTPRRGRPARSSSTATVGSSSAASPITTATAPSACRCWGRLYIRDKDLPELPEAIGWEFRTKPELAAEMITWAGSLATGPGPKPWVAVDGGYANREFIKPAKRAGFVVVARLRCDAELYDLPPVLKPGERRGRGRPPIYGKNRLSLAKRAGQTRGWQDRRGPDHGGPGRDQGGQVVPGDVGAGRGRGPGGDRQGGRRVVAGVPLHRPRGECRGDRAGDPRPLGDRAELPRPEGSRGDRAGAVASGVVERGGVEPEPVGAHAWWSCGGGAVRWRS